MLTIVTCNTNGIRAAARKGFFKWLQTVNADIVCIQETKAQSDQIDDPMYWPEGYHCIYNDALKKGYSGTALYSKLVPQHVTCELGWPSADDEGRYIQADFRELTVISLYLPSGSSSPQAQAKKFDFLDRFFPHLAALRESPREIILCADWNICHQPIDLKNWRANQKNSGFLPEERAWLDRIYDELGYVDSFRVVNEAPDQYTWWSNRGRAWDNNVGWRLDYQVISPGLRDVVIDAAIYKDQRFSDHAPQIMRYDLTLR